MPAWHALREKRSVYRLPSCYGLIFSERIRLIRLQNKTKEYIMYILSLNR